jgi:hypothetical protein
VSKASQQAVQHLEAAKQEATKARNLPEANAITAAIDQAKADITPQPKAPVGDWQVSFGNTLRAFRFEADGTVSTLDDPKPVPVGQLTRSGNACLFTEPQVVRRRKLYLTDDGYLLVMNYSLRTGEAEGCGFGKPLK